MKLPNGFGTVYKLSGKKHRNPYVAKKTKGWEIDQATGKAKQTYTVVGYYPTIAKMRFVDVKLDHLQMLVDESGKNYPTLRKLKVLLGLMYKYAVIHVVIPKERNMVEYLDIKKAGNPNAYNRQPFSKSEVARVWDVKDTNVYYTVVLMLIYSGCRISEMLDLKKENVMLDELWFKII